MNAAHDVSAARERREQRANRLARVMLSLGTGRGARVVIACCDRHRLDRAVARAAAARIGAQVLTVGDVRRERTRPDLVLACAEGLDRWKALGVNARVVSDSPGTLWWRLLESRQEAAPLTSDPAPLREAL